MSSKIEIYKDPSTRETSSIETGIRVAQNEPMVNHVFNRGVLKLLRNDLQIKRLYKAVFEQLNIVDYSANNTYSGDDLVWYEDSDKNLYLLKCITQNNTLEPNVTATDRELKESGWENQNKYLTILDYGITDLLDSISNAKIAQHQDDKDMHPFGEVSLDPSSRSFIGNKLLYNDFRNIDQSRKTTFFPMQVMKLDVGDVTMHGYSRQYGRVLEYDIIFKLATSAKTDITQIFDKTVELSANTLVLPVYSSYSKQNVNYQENFKYFSSTTDMDIFSNGDLSLSAQRSTIGLIVQINRNDYANTYSATITFPIPFANRDYMVFSNSVLSQTNSIMSQCGFDMDLVPSANDIVFSNKTRQSITAIDITFPDSTQYLNTGHNSKYNGLAANSFHCKMIGIIGA